jgi:hypothetical protein
MLRDLWSYRQGLMKRRNEMKNRIFQIIEVLKDLHNTFGYGLVRLRKELAAFQGELIACLKQDRLCPKCNDSWWANTPYHVADMAQQNWLYCEKHGYRWLYDGRFNPSYSTHEELLNRWRSYDKLLAKYKDLNNSCWNRIDAHPNYVPFEIFV